MPEDEDPYYEFLKDLEPISNDDIKKEIKIVKNLKNKISKFKEEALNYNNGITISYKEFIELISSDWDEFEDNLDTFNDETF